MEGRKIEKIEKITSININDKFVFLCSIVENACYLRSSWYVLLDVIESGGRDKTSEGTASHRAVQNFYVTHRLDQGRRRRRCPLGTRREKNTWSVTDSFNFFPPFLPSSLFIFPQGYGRASIFRFNSETVSRDDLLIETIIDNFPLITFSSNGQHLGEDASRDLES